MSRDELIGTRQAGQIAGRHPRTIVSWIHKGALPALKMAGEKGPYLIAKGDLMDTVKALTTPKPYVPKEKHDPGAQ